MYVYLGVISTRNVYDLSKENPNLFKELKYLVNRKDYHIGK